MSTCSHPATPSIAAEPVSPLVAPTIVTRSFRLASTWSNIAPDQLQRDVLERQRRAVEQLLHPELMVELDERRRRRDGGTTRTPRSHSRRSVASSRSGSTNGSITSTARSTYVRGLPTRRRAGELRDGQLRPVVRHVQPTVGRQAGEQDIAEARARAPRHASTRTASLSRRSRAAGRRCCAPRRGRAARARSPGRRTRGRHG